MTSKKRSRAEDGLRSIEAITNEENALVSVAESVGNETECKNDDSPDEDVLTLSMTTLLPSEPICWKCGGRGRKFQKATRRYDGGPCMVCGGLGRRQGSQRSKELACQPGIIQRLRGYPENHPLRWANSSLRFSGPRAVWGRMRFEKDNNIDHDSDDNRLDWNGLPSFLHPRTGEIVASLGCGDWRIYQLASGNKLTVDDFICAWVAAEEMQGRGFLHGDQSMFGGVHTVSDPSAGLSTSASSFFTHADLGTGCGSVLQMLAWAFLGQIRSVGVEAQEVSFNCLQRGLFWNLGRDGTHQDDTVRAILGDLRTWDGMLPANNDASGSCYGVPYDLITGTPPYFPLDSFVTSNNHMQKIRCRVPTRGGGRDYVKTAARLLADDGVFVMVEAAFDRAEAAVLQAVEETGSLRVKRRVDVVTRKGLPPRFSCWVVTKKQDESKEDAQVNDVERSSDGQDQKQRKLPVQTFTLRRSDLTRTAEYSEAMQKMGWVDFEQCKLDQEEKEKTFLEEAQAS